MASNEQVSNEDISKLTPEQRLKSLLFQYSKLYSRWSEDREEFNKGMAEQEEVLKKFGLKINQLAQQISNFEQLESQVRQNLSESVRRAAGSMVDNINENIGSSVTSSVNATAKELNYKLKDFYQALGSCKEEMQISQIKTFLVMMGASIVSSLLIVWLLVPKPIMPLSGDNMQTYSAGIDIQALWPKFSRRMQIEIDETSRKNFGFGHPFGDLTPRDDGNSGDGQQSGDNSG